MSGTEITEPSSAPTQLGTSHHDADGLRPSPRVTLEIGAMIGDRYRIEACIGMGGMATVFAARHTGIDKRVAIKVLGEELARKPALVERFMQEARAVSSIRHPHIVDITDFGYVRPDLPFYVMEYLEGETLADRLHREGRLPWPVTRRIALQLCEALQAAHEGGVVHRDMKPDNVFLLDHPSEPIFVKVLDFGIAKILGDDGSKDLTRTGVIMGTAAYMSPEQAKSRVIDARTDIYAAGIMIYQMLAGRVPFDGEGVMDVLTKHILEPVPPLRRHADVPSAVERVVLRALRKDRQERYGSARELADALLALGEDGRGRGGWIRWVLLVVALAAMVTAAVAAWTLVWPEGSSRPQPSGLPPAAGGSTTDPDASTSDASSSPSDPDDGFSVPDPPVLAPDQGPLPGLDDLEPDPPDIVDSAAELPPPPPIDDDGADDVTAGDEGETTASHDEPAHDPGPDHPDHDPDHDHPDHDHPDPDPEGE